MPILSVFASFDSFRNQIFLEIAEEVYSQYQAMLSLDNKIDFEDMIRVI